MQVTQGPIPTKTLLILLTAAGLAIAGYLVFSGEAKAWFDNIVWFVYEQQRGFSRKLTNAVTALQASESGATASLISLGFVYGVFHAVGPGHGKAVISAYALSHGTHLRRTVGLSFAAAIVQGLSAIAVVGILSLAVQGGIRRFAMSADDVLNPVSFAAVTAIGVYLLLRGGRAWRKARVASHTHHDHGHAHEHGHDHEGTCDCGHAHVPSPQQVAEATSPWHMATIAISVGIRPCSGAILVLVLSFAFGFVLSGIAAVLAMSLGTALTVSALAVGAQSLRWPLAKLFDHWGVHAGLFSATLMLAGGAVIIFVGATLLHGALTAPAHPFF